MRYYREQEKEKQDIFFSLEEVIFTISSNSLIFKDFFYLDSNCIYEIGASMQEQGYFSSVPSLLLSFSLKIGQLVDH